MKKLVCALALAGTTLLAGGIPAQAIPESCQTDMNKLAQVRLAAIERINKFGKKRPTATQACAAFGSLVSAETSMIKWLETNKDWCQIPDALIDSLKKGSSQGIKVRGQACTAAKREKQMRAQQRSGGGGGAPRPAVRLPSGAL